MESRPISSSTGLVQLSASELAALRESMRDLQLTVSAYHAETARRGDLGPRVRSFLVAAQTLNDLLSNATAEANSYKQLFASPRHMYADLIDGIKFARNLQQHVLHVIKPSDSIKLIGGVLGMRIYCDWDSIPAEAVARLRPGTQALEPAYRSALQGREVTSTMLAALQFFAEVCPDIVHRDARGEWTGFPLMSQPGMNAPIHPEEPTDLAGSRRWMDSRPPGGDCRVVCGQVTIEGVQYVYGHTFAGLFSFAPFVETVAQAEFDIQLGYPYLEGDIASNTLDVSERFPEARQGAVIASERDISSWTLQINGLANRDDWFWSGVDADTWLQFVRRSVSAVMPEGFTFSSRRAQRLNALVPPR